MTNHPFRSAFKAAVVAGALSGIPSTVWCIATRCDPLEATVAAGAMVLPTEPSRSKLLFAAVPVHGSISLAWAIVLNRVLPHRRTVISGALAGLGIAALDLGLLARFFPRVRALPVGPQLADHVAFGALAGAVIARCRATTEG